MKYRDIPELSKEKLTEFHSKINKTGECWLWKGKLNKAGYGQFSYNSTWFIVSRIMYYVIHGEVNPYLMVCHSCNNPICCKPEHLYLDTCSGNVQYSYDLGRSDKSGTRNCKAKLDEDKVKQIRVRWMEPQRLLAKEFGVDNATINHVLQNRTWMNVK